jgi:hypothetical protein
MLEIPQERSLTRENVEDCLAYLETLEGVKLGLGVRWQIPLRRLRTALESGTTTAEDERAFVQILREMEQEGGLLEFRNRLVETQMAPGYAEVRDLQLKLPHMTEQEVRQKLADVLAKLHKASADMDAAIEAAASNFLMGKPIESLDTVAALRIAHLDTLGQILMGALRAKGGNKSPEA